MVPLISPTDLVREESIIYSPFDDIQIEKQLRNIADVENPIKPSNIFSRKQKEIQKLLCDILFCIILIIYVAIDYNNSKPTAYVHLISVFEIFQFILEPIFQVMGKTLFKHMKMYMFTHFFVFLAYITFCFLSPSISARVFFMVACSFRLILCFRTLPVFFTKLIAFFFSFQRAFNKLFGYRESVRFRDSNFKAFFEQLFHALNFHQVLKQMSFVRDFSFILILLFIFGFSYASIGVTSFGGVIKYEFTNSSSTSSTDSGGNVMNTDFAKGEYWPLNFNDFLSALVTIFVLLIVNNMNVITDGIESNLTSMEERFLCKLFILSWYMIGVLLLLNILTSFIVLEVEKAANVTVGEKAASISRPTDDDSSRLVI
jgi:hypothetical protein